MKDPTPDGVARPPRLRLAGQGSFFFKNRIQKNFHPNRSTKKPVGSIVGHRVGGRGASAPYALTLAVNIYMWGEK